jgi:hypothetical protein
MGIKPHNPNFRTLLHLFAVIPSSGNSHSEIPASVQELADLLCRCGEQSRWWA